MSLWRDRMPSFQSIQSTKSSDRNQPMLVIPVLCLQDPAYRLSSFSQLGRNYFLGRLTQARKCGCTRLCGGWCSRTGWTEETRPRILTAPNPMSDLPSMAWRRHSGGRRC